MDFLAIPPPSTAALLNPKAVAAAAASAAAHPRPPPPAPSSQPPFTPVYTMGPSETQLAPAFSWRRARIPPPQANAPPRVSALTYNTDPFAYYTLDANPTVDGVPVVKQEEAYRPALTTDFAPFTSLHSITAAPQAHDQASQIPFVRHPFPEALTFSDPLIESVPSAVAARTAALRAAKGEATLREAMYGSHVGEAYAASLERFVREAVGEENSDLTKKWIEENVVRGVYGVGGLSVGRAVGEAWVKRRKIEAGDDEEEREEEQKPMVGAEQPAAAADGDEDVDMAATAAKSEPSTDDEPIPPASPSPSPSLSSLYLPYAAPTPNPTLLSNLATRTIRSLPDRHQHTAHLAAIRAVPISLPLLLHSADEFEAPVPVGLKRKLENENENEGGADGVLKSIGVELAELIREQESGGGSAGRSTRRARAKEEGDEKGEEDERMRRVRLMMVRLLAFRLLLPSALRSCSLDASLTLSPGLRSSPSPNSPLSQSSRSSPTSSSSSCSLRDPSGTSTPRRCSWSEPTPFAFPSLRSSRSCLFVHRDPCVPTCRLLLAH